MKTAIEQFLINLSGTTFSGSNSFEDFMRERIPALVEEIYKDELEVAYGIALDKQKQAFTNEIDKALREVHGGGNGRRLLVELKERIK